MVNLMNSNFEERFNPPFASFKSLTGGYVVRPLEWEGVWNPDGELVSGNAIVKCFDKEYADLIVDTFNRYFDLIKENKQLRNKVSNNTYTINALTHYLIKNDMAMEDILNIVKEFKMEVENANN